MIGQGNHGVQCRALCRPGQRFKVGGAFGLTASIVCALLLLFGCGSTAQVTAPLSTAAAEPATAAKPAPSPFDPNVGAPLPTNRIVAAYGIVYGFEGSGFASSLDMLNGFLPQLQQLGRQYAALDPTHPVMLAVDL